MNTTVLWQQRKGRLGRVWAALHNGLALLGVGALVFLLAQGGRWTPDPVMSRASAFGTIRYAAVSLFGPSEESDNPKHRAIANYLSRKYRVASDATEQLVGAAFDAGREVGIDPLLILAVMAIESRFNPIAESVMGAKGLMQVIPRHHQDKLVEVGGEESVLEPATNIQVGSRVLKEYIRRTGSLEAGLQLYAGALSDVSGQYAQKVIAEKDRLRQAMDRVGRQPGRSPAA